VLSEGGLSPTFAAWRQTARQFRRRPFLPRQIELVDQLAQQVFASRCKAVLAATAGGTAGQQGCECAIGLAQSPHQCVNLSLRQTQLGSRRVRPTAGAMLELGQRPHDLGASARFIPVLLGDLRQVHHTPRRARCSRLR
jgi:hypothetical protein